ncbi:hypothetical protein [Leeuwenhoekiella nanhaiensis]|uniref:GLPGLI family protein n=1 Tax=Leeuwenhoekiella nanhaiensis TaxID=1655491 RepID=A0A2G1VNN7_9FLAO|nr:hypothetical protein [Leeuwenhoekiella nanhaiensis]PHQ28387.1 hypothetical protein CJ305_14815 [Leeuwenhoekiella nanhaiensis]
MEKLLIGLICFLASYAQAQDSLYVYQTEGIVLKGKLNAKTRVQKGALLTPQVKVELQPQASLTAISKDGLLYTANDPGLYTHAMLLKRKTQVYPKNLSANYFKYIWSELLGNSTKPTQIGGVFRGESLMLFPADRSHIAGSRLEFRWLQDAPEASGYLFIREAEGEAVLKLESNGSSLAFYDNPFFEEGKSYEWAVTTEAFPNLSNLRFFSFKHITKAEYEVLREAFISELNNPLLAGLSKQELEKLLCEEYGLCK